MATMRSGPAAFISVALLATLGAGCQKGAPKDPPLGAPDGGTAAQPSSTPPPWLGTYEGEQKKLLEMPVDTPVEARAPRVYPDLARFTFLGEGPVRVPDHPLAYARLVTQALQQSPLLYVFRTGPETLANVRALYGPEPAPRPDDWKHVVVAGGKPPALRASPPSAAARPFVDQAMQKQGAEALDLLRKAAAEAGGSPGVHVMLADAALAAGDHATAESAAQEALKIDPRFPSAHRVLAEAYLRKGDPEKARAALAEALAYYPVYDRAWKVAEVLTGRPIQRNRAVPPPFIEVNTMGAVVVVTCDRPMCERYAGCKAAFRYEPGFRSSVLHEPLEIPYHLSVTEDVACLEAGLGAHIEAMQARRGRPDPMAELLIRLAAEEGLTAYTMFEIVGQHRPEWMRVAPQPAHDAMVGYIKKRVLGGSGPVAPIAPLPEDGTVGPIEPGEGI